MIIIVFFPACDLFVLSARSAGSPIQHVFSDHSLRICSIRRFLTIYRNCTSPLEKRTKRRVDPCVDRLLWIVLLVYHG